MMSLSNLCKTKGPAALPHVSADSVQQENSLSKTKTWVLNRIKSKDICIQRSKQD